MRFAALLATVAALAASTAVAAPRADAPFIPDGDETAAPRGFVDMCGRDATFCGAGPIEARDTMVTAAIVEQPSPSGAWRVLPAMFGWKAPLPSPAYAPAQDVPVQFVLTTLTGAAPAARRFLPFIAVPPAPVAEPAPSARPASDGLALLRSVNHQVNGHVAQMTDERRWGRDEYWVRSGVGGGAAGDCEDIAIEKRYELIAAGFSADRLAFAVVYLPKIGLHTVLVARTGEGDMVLDSRTPYVERWDRTRYSWVSIQTMGRPMAWHGLHTRALHYVAADTENRRAG